MANPAPGGASDYNAKIIEEFRANRGRVGGPWEGTTLILLHHIGAKSGIERITPLGCFPQARGDLVIVASSGGSSTHPGWYYNLKADPGVTVEEGTQTFAAQAEELDDTARAELLAETGRGASHSWRTPGQDHAADSCPRPDPPGLTCGREPPHFRPRGARTGYS